MADFAVIAVVNQTDVTNKAGAAHIAALRVESFGYLSGTAFAILGRYPGAWPSRPDPVVVDLATPCLRIRGVIRCSFAAALVYAGGLAGAEDTLAVMALNPSSFVLLRLPAVLIVGLWLRLGLPAMSAFSGWPTGSSHRSSRSATSDVSGL